MTKSKFNVGDIVVWKNKNSTDWLEGEVIKCLGCAGDELWIYVMAENEHCYFVKESSVELKTPSNTNDHRFNLVITSAGDVTTAKLLYGKTTAMEVSVKRYCEDKYSEEAAVRAVCEKLFKKKAAKEAELSRRMKQIEEKMDYLRFCNLPPLYTKSSPTLKGINYRVVCKRNVDRFTKGKIYQFVDGRCVDDDNCTQPPYLFDKISDENCVWFKSRFLRIIKEAKE